MVICYNQSKLKFICLMVLILAGNSEIGAHVWSDLGYLIDLFKAFVSKAVTNLNYFF